MVWNEEEDQKSHLFGDFSILIELLTLEAYSAAIGSRKQGSSSPYPYIRVGMTCRLWRCGSSRSMAVETRPWQRFRGHALESCVNF